ncbi:hypothetical protein H6783_03185 [Candidatus Nomurabacteria bacterium]|nr:hypothetical protein [Candidatus Nomurabacteria bacterium]
MKWLQRIIYRFCFSCRTNRSRTVRYAFPLIVTAFSLIGAAVILPSDASYMRLEFSSATIEAGKPFSVDVFVGAHVPVNAINIDLEYPEDKVAITGIDTGESVITIWTTEPYAENGVVHLSGGTFRRGFLGEHRIVTINAVAKATGIAQFAASDVAFLAGDGSGTEVAATKVGEKSVVIVAQGEDGVLTATAEIRVYTDINGDGKVTLTDILQFMAAWTDKKIIYDFNEDKRMNFTDFSIILADSWRR